MKKSTSESDKFFDFSVPIRKIYNFNVLLWLTFSFRSKLDVLYNYKNFTL